jgi:hypothetical protein
MKKVNINKVPIYSLLTMLNMLYEEGANFVDIEGENNNNEDSDTIILKVKNEYYIDYNETEEHKLTDDEINDLI